ncbi:hypothetical protein OIE66_40835 [Nonomuraea sp. NBC_01738]|uniref:aminoacyl-tRNA deacylase n=1 Tax=Nonomuraea sp. NBC_01738 TaxID=2976003 RepID=UPI002E13C665|nr:hypothetical protein OIE66_40835 [Nonomuraea sp. NBC_01738]
MKDALAIHRWLLAHQVHHEIVRLPRPMTCADELPEMISAGADRCVSVTVFEGSTRRGRSVVATVHTVAAPPRPAVVGALVGTRNIHLAPAFLVNAVTDYAAPLVCPLLLPESLTVLVDERLRPDRTPIFTPTGERHTALAMRALDLLTLLSRKLVDLRTQRPSGSRQAVALRH